MVRATGASMALQASCISGFSMLYSRFFGNGDLVFGGIAQLGERLHGMQEVSGSIPLTSTKDARCPVPFV